jgi:hypothetical protein
MLGFNETTPPYLVRQKHNSDILSGPRNGSEHPIQGHSKKKSRDRCQSPT